jgi:hypothetical protein
MSETLSVRLSLRDDPVVLESANLAGVSASHVLWDGMVASEYFPPMAESAFYIVTLEKPVEDPSDVFRVEQELTDALLSIAAAWSFSGGSHMVLESRHLILSPRFESNAAVVEQELLARTGQRRLTSGTKVSFEVLATYARPPLASAARIASYMQADFQTSQLLDYYQRAYADRSLWFVHLYKIREVIKSIYRSPAKRGALGFKNSDWRAFGCLLNAHDLRHASRDRKAPAIASTDIDRLYAIACRWISAHLVNVGLISNGT